MTKCLQVETGKHEWVTLTENRRVCLRCWEFQGRGSDGYWTRMNGNRALGIRHRLHRTAWFIFKEFKGIQ